MPEREMNMKTHVLLTLGAFAGMALPAIAQEGTVTTATVYACADIAADGDRLACYDSAVGRLKSAEESGEVVTVTREQVENVQRDSFGFSLPSLPSLTLPKFGGSADNDGQLDEVTMPVARAGKNGEGKVTVTLENGQVWVQTDSKAMPSAVYKRATEARISRGIVGSYFMTLDTGRGFKVERVK
jgi:hypothetical protein